MIAVLFRMAEPFGMITIDGVEIKNIGLHDLRKKISIIPQVVQYHTHVMHYMYRAYTVHTISIILYDTTYMCIHVYIRGLENEYFCRSREL